MTFGETQKYAKRNDFIMSPPASRENQKAGSQSGL
jgi:hypothetical protein